MNQIKYMISACLILLSFVTIVFFFNSITSSSKEANRKEIIIDYVSPENGAETNLSKGKKLFQQNCQSCHALDKNITGPALRNFVERGPWHYKNNIYKWINNPAAFMAKDIYTQKLQKEYGAIMTSFPQLTKDEIDAIVDYTMQTSTYSPVAVAKL